MIYERVKQAADKKKIRISALEKEAGLGNGSIRKWKSSSPNIDSLKAVAKVLGVKVSDLIE